MGEVQETKTMTLAESVVKLLAEDELTVTTAESCTGGLVAARLVDVPGVSEVFKQGFITYSNKAKRKILNVKKETLKTLGAVSEKTAKEMAKGAILASGADAAIATTGIAGPDGGTEEKPVGLVYIAVSVRGQMYVEEHHFEGDRAAVRESTVEAALALLKKGLEETGEE
ncbi:CinA family protein [Anaerosacchariphilus sp. NSJ-68]|uniref:CinA family protein n=2 Tax=Lachnospiraceae TaxID=186803 RepID=A0A923LBS7_9FIRM|nr:MULTISPECIES: CinA family protein [Lachnospiraceae]MBC5659628.1 CinA family protein [Anaerosacchariphilus hominis]MBC5697295.1 CinA family protein [Roseburia difficilis]